MIFFFFFQAEDGIRDLIVTGVQTCALPISPATRRRSRWTFSRRQEVIVADGPSSEIVLVENRARLSVVIRLSAPRRALECGAATRKLARGSRVTRRWQKRNAIKPCDVVPCQWWTVVEQRFAA